MKTYYSHKNIKNSGFIRTSSSFKKNKPLFNKDETLFIHNFDEYINKKTTNIIFITNTKTS